MKNQSSEILLVQRPLLVLKGAELAALFIHAQFMAAEAKGPDRLAAQVKGSIALTLLRDVERECAWRN